MQPSTSTVGFSEWRTGAANFVEDGIMSSKTPAMVIKGFPGPGKTEMIRHILENAEGQRIALIVNASRARSRLRLDAPFAKREARPSEIFDGRRTNRAVAVTVGEIFFEQPNSAYAEFGCLPRSVLFFPA